MMCTCVHACRKRCQRHLRPHLLYRKDDSEEQAPALLADGAADSSKQSESDIFVPPSKGKKRSFL